MTAFIAEETDIVCTEIAAIVRVGTKKSPESNKARDSSNPKTEIGVEPTPLAYALAYAGRHEEARDVLGAIEKSTLPLPSASIAPVYLALGEPGKAIALLQDACERGLPQFAWSRDDPRLAALRGNSEVERLWARIWPRQMVDSLAA